MPYTMENPPERIKNLPKHAAEIWIAAFNSAVKQYDGNEQKANAVAWAAVKRKYEKNDKGIWVLKKENAYTEWIPIFRTGVHTDSNGNTETWTEKRLDRIVELYDPAKHEAPLVIGHPKTNSPAWGWTEALKREGQILYAKVKDLAPEFVEMLRRKMFKKRSISLYPDGSLRHIGFLGAKPPAVKGLPDIPDFGDGGGLTIEFEEIDKPVDRRKKRKEVRIMKFFDWLKGKAAEEGVVIEDIPQSFSESDVKARIEAEVEERLKAKAAEFSEKEEVLKKKEEALEKEKDKARKKAISDFCEDLKKKGILVPAMEKFGMGLRNFLEQISSIETPVEFSEGDEKKTQTPLEFMQAFLSSLPKAIEFGEVAGDDRDIGTGNAAEKMARLVNQKLSDNNKLSYAQAFAEVQSENPELAEQYVLELQGK